MTFSVRFVELFILKELLEDFHLLALNTMRHDEHTYYGDRGCRSRIDYICLTESMWLAGTGLGGLRGHG